MKKICCRTRILHLAGALLGGVLLTKCGAQPVAGLDAVRVATGLTQPLFMTAPPEDTQRLFIVCQTGQVRILDLQSGTLKGTPFLDIHSRLTSTSGEQGLLGLAFDPNYASNGKFYLDFTVPGGASGNGVTHVSQFQVSTTNADVADVSNEKILLTFDHPQNNHNGGWIGFSPRPGDENNLYISTGDGGNGNDSGTGHIEPGGNAQNNTTLLGKILRLQIDPVAGSASIPTNNPFAGSATFRNEIWAYGLRNPFRASFDRLTGTLFIGDVGQSTREEIDVQKPTNPVLRGLDEQQIHASRKQTPHVSHIRAEKVLPSDVSKLDQFGRGPDRTGDKPRPIGGGKGVCNRFRKLCCFAGKRFGLVRDSVFRKHDGSRAETVGFDDVRARRQVRGMDIGHNGRPGFAQDFVAPLFARKIRCGKTRMLQQCAHCSVAHERFFCQRRQEGELRNPVRQVKGRTSRPSFSFHRATPYHDSSKTMSAMFLDPRQSHCT